MAASEPLIVLEQRLAVHREEVARLELAIAQHPDATQPDVADAARWAMSRLSSVTSLPNSPSSAYSLFSPAASSRSSIMDEPWATTPSREMGEALTWLQNWRHAFPAPAIPSNEHMRVKAAQALAEPQEGDVALFSRLCQLARLIFHVPFAAVNIVAQDSVSFRGCDIVEPSLVGMKGAPREVSLCNWTIAKGRTLVMADMATEPATKANPIVVDHGCRFYAGAPLTTASGLHVGTFCLLDTAPNHNFNESAQALLELLSTTAVTLLELTRLKASRERFHQHVLANLSHELRTPIHGIIGLCDLIVDSNELSAPQLEHLTDARDQTREMLSQINDLLDFVKLDAGQLSLKPGSFRPFELLTRTCEMLEPAASGRLLKLRLFQPYAAKMTCRGDERRIAQLLTNLLTNGIKFSKPHNYVELHATHHSSKPDIAPSSPTYNHYSPTLSSSLFPSSSTTSSSSRVDDTFYLHIRVADAGSGISRERLPHVFNKFYEEELQAFAPRIDGVGLGLAVCRLLTELMSGELLVESEVGEGSVFHIVLPLQYEEHNSAEAGITETERQALVQRRSVISTTLQQTPPQSPGSSVARRLTNFNNQTNPTLIRAATIRRLNVMSSPRHSQSASASPDGPVARSVVRVANLRPSASVPATPSPAARPPIAKPPRPAASAALVDPALSILIVDDNQINLKVAARILTGSGHVCLCAAGGAEALELLQEKQVDVVLMDLQMPDMDGLESTRRIRQLEADGRLQRSGGDSKREGRLPIIAVTASERAGIEEECVAAGMDDCMFKPFNKQQILAMIAVTLAKQGAG